MKQVVLKKALLKERPAKEHEIQLNLPILFEDNHFVAINKPSGLLVHRSEIDRHETRFAVQMVRDQLNQFVYPVHRLDKPTSGVLLFAKSKEMLTAVSTQFESHQVSKTYIAFVRGFTPPALTIDHPVKSRRDERDKRSLSEPKAGLTELKRLHTYEMPVSIEKYPQSRFSLVELTPKTGRRHQLRYHMKHISHPIIGDGTYGRGGYNRYFKDNLNSNRLLLAAVGLIFAHPETEAMINISAPLGDDFESLLNQMRAWQL